MSWRVEWKLNYDMHSSMLRLLFVLIGCLSCSVSASADIENKLPVEAYIDPIDRQIAATGVGIPGRPSPCAYEKTDERGTYVIEVPTDQCVKMLSKQHWRGIWRNQFEGQLFCPDPCGPKGDLIWMTDRTKTRRNTKEGVYRIEFEGRQTMYRGSYGHFGLADHEVIVDRMISIRRVGGLEER